MNRTKMVLNEKRTKYVGAGYTVEAEQIYQIKGYNPETVKICIEHSYGMYEEHKVPVYQK